MKVVVSGYVLDFSFLLGFHTCFSVASAHGYFLILNISCVTSIDYTFAFRKGYFFFTFF